jgi:hypothetical protein
MLISRGGFFCQGISLSNDAHFLHVSDEDSGVLNRTVELSVINTIIN